MALPKEPRQKMINIMYLVLTALLALNVSAEILNAFKTVDNSLRGTNQVVNKSTTTILASLLDKKGDPSSAEKAGIWYPKAQAAQAATKDVFEYIEGLRSKILKEAGLDVAKNHDSSYKADQLDIATRIMIEQGEGKKLREKLEKYRKDLLAIDPLIAAEFQNSLQIDVSMPKVQDKTNHDWSNAYFHMVPTVAALTILDKFGNDVKTSENKVVAFCHEQVGKVTVRFDQFAVLTGQSSNYVMPGQQIDVTAGVGAFSKASVPVISINGQTRPLEADGQAHAKIDGGSLGKHQVEVVVNYKDQDGKPHSEKKMIEYTVGQANASIALDKMNVLYVGVANPITVAASGGGDDKIEVSISNGRLQKTGPGKYNAFVDGGNEATITVSVDKKAAGASQFRVRQIPAPTASVGGFASGDNVNAGAFKAQAGVIAWIKDFPFDIKYTVTEFTISTDDEGDIVEQKVSGNSWAGKANNVMSKVAPGKTVYIDGIRAQAESGKSFKLPSLVYYIK